MSRRYQNLMDRILSNTVLDGECWRWTAKHNNKGYGQLTVRVPGRRYPVNRYVHRIAFELVEGRSIAPGMTLDHRFRVCQHKDCWRREHLEEVTREENTLRVRLAEIWGNKPRLRRRGNKRVDLVTFP